MSTTTDTRTTEAAVTVDGAHLAAAFRRLRQVGRARPVTVYQGGAGLILAVRVTASRPGDGTVAVTVPCEVVEEGKGAFPYCLAGGVLSLDIEEGRPYVIRGEVNGTTAMLGEWAVKIDPFVGYNPGAGKAAIIPPDLDPFRVGGGFVLPAADFADAAARVIPAAAPAREVRQALTGVNFVPTPAGAIELVATDSYRLHAATCPVREGIEYAGDPRSSTDPTTLIPAAFVARLAREAGRRTWGPEVRIARAYRGGHPWTVVKGGGGVVLLVSNIAAQAPDHVALLERFAEDAGLPFTVPKAGMLEALDNVAQRAKPAGGGKAGMAILCHNAVGMAVTRHEGEAAFTASIPAAWGATFEDEGYNAAFLRDFIEAVPTDRVDLHTYGPLRPLMVANANYRALLMPVRMP